MKGNPEWHEILDEGKYRGYDYRIISHGTHPCAYIAIDNIANYPDNIDEIDVHGGFTFDSQHPYFNNRWCIGWDYAHDTDYYAAFGENSELAIGTHHWTTAEILNEVHSVIDQIVDYKNINQ